MWNIPMLDGRPKSTDYCTGVIRHKKVTNKPYGTFNRDIMPLIKQKKEIKHQLKTSKSKLMQNSTFRY